MNSHYDPSVDALFVNLSDRPVLESEEIAPGIIFDYDADGRIVSIEVLNATKRVPADAIPVAAE